MLKYFIILLYRLDDWDSGGFYRPLISVIRIFSRRMYSYISSTSKGKKFF